VILKPGLGSLKVIGTVTYRSATSDFLLTFHGNYGPILYRFWDRRRFQSKIDNVSHQCILRPSRMGSPWNWVSALGVKKLESWCYRTDRERCLTIFSAVWIQYTNMMDRRTPDDSKDRAIAH